MSLREDTLIRLAGSMLVKLAPPLLATRFRPDCCIAATALCCATLRMLEIHAKPLEVQCVIGNEAWTHWRDDRRTRGVPLTRDELVSEGNTSGAWSVGIGFNSPGARGYVGHLVCLVGEAGFTQRHIIDLTLPQASRPEHGINLQAIWLPDLPDNFVDGHVEAYTHIRRQIRDQRLVQMAKAKCTECGGALR